MFDVSVSPQAPGGATGIYPFEVQAGNDVRKIYSDFPDKFMIVGGINKRALSKDYEAIEGEVDRVMGYFKGKRGYLSLAALIQIALPVRIQGFDSVFSLNHVLKLGWGCLPIPT